MGITFEWYCDDCEVNHNCTECDRMNWFVQKYIDWYNERLLNQLKSEENTMTAEQTKYHSDYDKWRYWRERRKW